MVKIKDQEDCELDLDLVEKRFCEWSCLVKKILLTGGGSAGHITVNLALIPLFIQAGWSVIYLGSINGIE